MYCGAFFFFVNWIYLDSRPLTFMYPYLLSIDSLGCVVLHAQNIKIYKIFTVYEFQYTNPGG